MNGDAIVEYSRIAGLENFYFEDSWVLSVTAKVNVLEIELELVLTEDHWAYVTPGPKDKYSYRRALLIFGEMTDFTWREIASRPNPGVGDEAPDYGNIDRFQSVDDCYELEGDFGQILVKSARPLVVLASQ